MGLAAGRRLARRAAQALPRLRDVFNPALEGRLNLTELFCLN
jgi:hypothetical protein